MILFMFLTCGCTGEKENSQTRFLLDTVATITANCDDKTLDGAFSLCEKLEKTLSRSVKVSDVYKLNNTDDFVNVSEHTLKIVERSLYFSKISGGKFDITVYPLSSIWDFKNQIVPSKDEISQALKNIDYNSIEIKDDKISLNGKKIDLGGVAKGYIADKVVEYLKNKGVKNAIVNLGGNIAVLGEYNIGIKEPFGDNIATSITVKDKTVVTSGIYERYIKKEGKIYHHILDTKTGYGVENNLASVTVIGESSMDCDALSTVCMLLGEKEAEKIINNTKNTEAVFITRTGEISVTQGLVLSGGIVKYKN